MTDNVIPATENASLILTSKQDGVTTLKMNRPARLNGWTMEMIEALREGLVTAAADD